MANRAYLFFSETAEPINCDRNAVKYYDSRWNIPFAWWFFFDSSSLVAKDVSYMNSNWKEPRLVKQWNEALILFRKRTQHILLLSKGKSSESELNKFCETLSTFSNNYLQLDGSSIFQDEDRDHIQIKSILECIDNIQEPTDECAAIIDKYTHILEKSDPEQYQLNMIGYTYAWP